LFFQPQDYTEHQKQIYAKLVSIMGDRLTIHMKAMNATPWAQQGPADGKPNQYMQALVKDLVTLHKVLSKYLSNDVLQGIVGQVVEIYNSRIEEELQNLPITSSAAKHRVLADVQFYVQELGMINDTDASNRLTLAVNNLNLKVPSTLRSTSPVNPARAVSPHVLGPQPAPSGNGPQPGSS
jgi:vacuolar protein sorting-associated protein 54